MQKCATFVDFEKCYRMGNSSQKLALIQPRTSLPVFDNTRASEMAVSRGMKYAVLRIPLPTARPRNKRQLH